jgi:hypothetical protein
VACQTSYFEKLDKQKLEFVEATDQGPDEVLIGKNISSTQSRDMVPFRYLKKAGKLSNLVSDH